MAYNNAYVDGQWGLFRHTGAMRLITCKASLVGIELSTSPINPLCKAYPAFTSKVCATWGTGTRRTMSRIPESRTSPSRGGPSR